MPNGIYLTLEQYKDKDLPLTITVNGNTYHSQFALATAQTTYFEMGKQHGMELGSDNTYSDNEMSSMHDAWYDNGYTKGYEDGKKSITQEEFDRGWAYGYDAGKEEGYEAGKKANGYTVDDIKQLHTDNEFTRKIWYDKGKAEGYGDGPEQTEYAKGYEEGKAAGYGKGWIEGHNTKTIKYFDEYSVKLEERLNSRYDAGYNDGYEQCKHDGISKINLNTEPVEQTELSKEYDKGFTKGYAEGYNDAKGEDDYCKDCKEEPGKDEQNAKELPGEYLSHIEEARLEGYADGLGEYLSHIEEARLEGYADGFNDGKEQGFEEGFMNLKLILKK